MGKDWLVDGKEVEAVTGRLREHKLTRYRLLLSNCVTEGLSDLVNLARLTTQEHRMLREVDLDWVHWKCGGCGWHPRELSYDKVGRLVVLSSATGESRPIKEVHGTPICGLCYIARRDGRVRDEAQETRFQTCLDLQPGDSFHCGQCSYVGEVHYSEKGKQECVDDAESTRRIVPDPTGTYDCNACHKGHKEGLVRTLSASTTFSSLATF